MNQTTTYRTKLDQTRDDEEADGLLETGIIDVAANTIEPDAINGHIAAVVMIFPWTSKDWASKRL
jgi:hypothetical protein